MSLSIRWTSEAEESFSQIIFYLENKWSERQVKKFLQTVNKTIFHIAKFPYMFEASLFKPNVRKAFITKQCSLFYEVGEDTIVLLFFWDNRRKPLSTNQ
ncbi:type II toxin-antitoxin system RelE/ParE family toxin [Dyadobacter bucti]|jgi:plasmid stabilization system protein ParE|uniref:type II toxin-antitoxin system RelE/ParE family toxin n=1 Tax=Dyadobacter bucti TaxID=2572203 RepID=UPI003F71D796